MWALVVPSFPDGGARFKSVENPCEICDIDSLRFFNQELSFLLVLKQCTLVNYCDTNLTIWHIIRDALSILDLMSYLTRSWNKYGS
jgi:hypothetical protein